MTTDTNAMNPPTLTGTAIRLTGLTTAHAPRLAQACQDPVTQAMTTVPRPYDAQHAAGFIEMARNAWGEDRGSRVFAIEAPTGQDGEHHYVGTIELRQQQPNGRAEVAYMLHPDERGKGYMSEAVRLACTWWFEQGGESVLWHAFRGNLGSWRPAWANGFQYVGIIPRHVHRHGGEAVDAYTAVLTHGDTMSPAAPWHTPPVLTGEGLTLRPWSDDDARYAEPAHHPAHHMPPGAEFTPRNAPEKILTYREGAAFGNAVAWAITCADSERVVGLVMVGGLSDGGHQGWLGFQVLPSARGRGVAARASRIAVEYAFGDRAAGGLGLRQLTAVSAADNVGSARTLSRVGFSRTGCDPTHDVVDDEARGRGVGLMRWRLGAPDAPRSDGVDAFTAAPADWRRLRALRLRALAENPEAFTSTVADSLALPEDVWRERAAAGNSAICVVDGLDAGLCAVVRPDEPDWPEDHAYLVSMWVDDTVRRRGAGRALLDASIAYARRTGASRLVLQVYPTQEAARKLYAASGFVEVPTCAADVARCGGREQIRMELTLSDA